MTSNFRSALEAHVFVAAKTISLVALQSNLDSIVVQNFEDAKSDLVLRDMSSAQYGKEEELQASRKCRGRERRCKWQC